MPFDESLLKSYHSWELPEADPPMNQPLPPGRNEHQNNLSIIARFSRVAQRHPRAFRAVALDKLLRSAVVFCGFSLLLLDIFYNLSFSLRANPRF